MSDLQFNIDPAKLKGMADAMGEEDYTLQTDDGALYPWVQWIEANANPLFPAGGAFISVDQPKLADVREVPAQPILHKFRGGDTTMGVPLNPVYLQVLGTRTDWGIPDPSGKEGRLLFIGTIEEAQLVATRFSGGKIKSRTQLLCLVRGFEGVGPMALTVSGNKASMLKEEFGKFKARAFAPFSNWFQENYGKPAPIFGLYFALAPAAPKLVGSGQQKSPVTPPVWAAPANISDIIVPEALWQEAALYWPMAKEWELSFRRSGQAEQFLAMAKEWELSFRRSGQAEQFLAVSNGTAPMPVQGAPQMGPAGQQPGYPPQYGQQPGYPPQGPQYPPQTPPQWGPQPGVHPSWQQQGQGQQPGYPQQGGNGQQPGTFPGTPWLNPNFGG